MGIDILLPVERPTCKVSVVMPTYRRAQAIGRTIQTIQDGRFEDWQLLVRDDSREDDGTEDIVCGLATQDPRIYYKRNPRSLGVPGNVNYGITDSSGEFVVVCHDHDLYHRDYLHTLAGLLDRHPSASYAHCGVVELDSAGSPTGRSFIGTWPELLPGSDWLAVLLGRLDCPVSGLTMVRRRAYESMGLYDSDFGIVSDVEMWMRLTKAGDVAYARGPLIELMGRESNHSWSQDPWPAWVSAFQIHRKYCQEVNRGIARHINHIALSMRIDALVTRALVARTLRGRRPILSQLEILRESGGPLSRLIVLLAGVRLLITRNR